MAKDFMTGLKTVAAQLPNSTFSELERIKKELIVVLLLCPMKSLKT